ncbi:MAG: PEP-CTERM sorting domain-containing protein [Phycisphaerales bacterium]|nr:PEP-CTERM sorting domain-containing protein [Phycisphaerales bacterium]
MNAVTRLSAALMIVGLGAGAQASPYFIDDFTYQGSTPTSLPTYTAGFNASRAGDDIDFIFNWPDDDIGATYPLPGALRVNYGGSVGLDEQTQIRNDTTLTTDVRVEVDARSVYAAGNYMMGLILSESTDPWSSGKSLFFGRNDVQDRWEIRQATAPISAAYLSGGSTLLGTVNVGRNGWPTYDHLTIERAGGAFTFIINGNTASGVGAVSGNFQYAGVLMGAYGRGGQSRFDNLQYTDLAVPEPGTGLLILALAGGLLVRRRMGHPSV